MLVVAYGGGTNSTAMLVGLHERGIRPDLCLFSDTGGEKHETYDHLRSVQGWLEGINFPPVTVVRVASRTLEEDCLKRSALPSIAYGFKSCSQRFKLEPQEKFLNNHPPCREVWDAGEKVIKLIGYDADEERRAKAYDSDKYEVQYPLIEWGWDRDACIEAIDRAGLPRPGKSACFFCPSSRPSEVRWLQRTHPDLFMRAVEMERNADLTSVKGLGRNWSWEALGSTEDMFDPVHTVGQACGCFDGDD